MTPEEQASIRSGLRKLGPERCQEALAAFERPFSSWQTCLLARAYGRAGKLYHALTEAESVNVSGAAHFLGLTYLEVSCIIDAFDDHSMRPWLEQEVRAVAELTQPKVLA